MVAGSCTNEYQGCPLPSKNYRALPWWLVTVVNDTNLNEAYRRKSRRKHKQQETILLPRVPCIFFEEPADKKTKIPVGEKNRRSYYRCTWYTYHISDALDNHEQTGGGPGCKRRASEGQMRRSHVFLFGLVATCDSPTQKLPIFFNLIQNHEKYVLRT